jgi:TorA maturation chaperone TorD
MRAADFAADPPIAGHAATRAAAAVRSAAYALCSELVAPPAALAEGTSLAASAAALVTLLPGLPFALALPELTLAELDSQLTDTRRCRRQYTGLFQAGDPGAAIAIRESQARARDSSVTDRLRRLFESCGYPVDQRHGGDCDHLAVELQFLEWLCFHEARSGDRERRGVLQHAQRDFLNEHVLAWLPELARQVALMAPAGPYQQIFSSVHRLATADLSYCHARLQSAARG